MNWGPGWRRQVFLDLNCCRGIIQRGHNIKSICLIFCESPLWHQNRSGPLKQGHRTSEGVFRLRAPRYCSRCSDWAYSGASCGWTDMWGGHFNTSSVMTSLLWTGPLSYRSKLATFGWMLTVSPTWIPIPMASRLSDALQRDDRGHSLYSPLVFNVVADTCKVCLQISALRNRSVFLVLDTPNSYRNC